MTSNPNTSPAGDHDTRERPHSTPSTAPKRLTVSRRDFVKFAGVTAVIVAAGAGGAAAVKTFTQSELEGLKAAMAQVLAERYGETKGQMLDQKIQQELETTAAQLPTPARLKKTNGQSSCRLPP